MENVWLNVEVDAIDVESRSAKIGDTEVVYDYLINTIPFNHLLKLCSIPDKEQLLSSNQVLVFNIGFDSALNETECHWIYYPSEEFIFYRVGFYNNILQSKMAVSMWKSVMTKRKTFLTLLYKTYLIGLFWT